MTIRLADGPHGDPHPVAMDDQTVAVWSVPRHSCRSSQSVVGDEASSGRGDHPVCETRARVAVLDQQVPCGNRSHERGRIHPARIEPLPASLSFAPVAGVYLDVHPVVPAEEVAFWHRVVPSVADGMTMDRIDGHLRRFHRSQIVGMTSDRDVEHPASDPDPTHDRHVDSRKIDPRVTHDPVRDRLQIVVRFVSVPHPSEWVFDGAVTRLHRSFNARTREVRRWVGCRCRS